MVSRVSLYGVTVIYTYIYKYLNLQLIQDNMYPAPQKNLLFGATEAKEQHQTNICN